MRHNRVWGLIYFAHNYTEALIERIAEREKASKMAMNLSDVQIYQDMSSKLHWGAISQLSYKVLIQDMSSKLQWGAMS